MKCQKCGVIFTPTSRNQKYCGSYRKKIGCSYLNKKQYNIDFIHDKYPERKLTQKFRYFYIKKNAKHRNINFDITQEDYSNYFKKPCEYCNGESVGLDRVDSSRGYEIGNIVPCCPTCNYMKNTLDKDFWVAHMKKIILNLESK